MLAKLFNIKRQLNKPEYWFNPGQLVRRLQYKNKGRRQVGLDIGDQQKDFFVNENEVIGRSLLTMGVYDLVVAETMKRVLKPGAVFFDVGANIGYFSRLALRWQAQVYAFEPHPLVFERLRKNLDNRKEVRLFNQALSNEKGAFNLYVPKDFSKNEGIASLQPLENSEPIEVETLRLDAMGFDGMIDLMKVDVEGHELQVLRGAEKLLDQQRIQNILFEDFHGASSPAINFLKDYGFEIRGLLKTPLGPELLELSELHRLPSYEPPNFLASLDMETLKSIFAQRGWEFYQSRL